MLKFYYFAFLMSFDFQVGVDGQFRAPQSQWCITHVFKTSLYPKQTVSAKLKQISLRFWESALATHPYPNPTLTS